MSDEAKKQFNWAWLDLSVELELGLLGLSKSRFIRHRFFGRDVGRGIG